MMRWLHDMALLAGVQDAVLVSVIRTQGSCPREAATRMIVTSQTCLGTIGGGHLEYQAIQLATSMLNEKSVQLQIERFPLGARLGQCCGGVVHLSFEFIPLDHPGWLTNLHTLQKRGNSVAMVSELPQSVLSKQTLRQGNRTAANRLIVSAHGAYTGSLSSSDLEALVIARALALLSDAEYATTRWQDNLLFDILPVNNQHIAVFGAGHVGKALVNILSTITCTVNWVDSRAAEFPDITPDNVHISCSDHPEDEVDNLPDNSQVIVMTHSHAVDEAICERALRRHNLGFVGLIGSLSKRRQFEKRLRSRGLSAAQWDKLCCPIGVIGIDGKQPEQIAIAVSAQLLQSHDGRQALSRAPESVQATGCAPLSVKQYLIPGQ